MEPTDTMFGQEQELFEKLRRMPRRDRAKAVKMRYELRFRGVGLVVRLTRRFWDVEGRRLTAQQAVEQLRWSEEVSQ